MELSRIIESLLFATDRPLTPKALAHALHEAAKLSPGPETLLHAKVSVGRDRGRAGAIARQPAGGRIEPARARGRGRVRPEDAAGIRRVDEPAFRRAQGAAPEPARAGDAGRHRLSPAHRPRGDRVGPRRGGGWRGGHAAGAQGHPHRRAVPTSRAGRCFTRPRRFSWNSSASRGWTNCPTPTNCAASNRNLPMPPNNSKSALSSQMLRLRQQVDRIDQKLLRLLQQRTKLSDRDRADEAPAWRGNLRARPRARTAGPRGQAGRTASCRGRPWARSSAKSCRARARRRVRRPSACCGAAPDAIMPAARCHFGACDRFVSTVRAGRR